MLLWKHYTSGEIVENYQPVEGDPLIIDISASSTEDGAPDIIELGIADDPYGYYLNFYFKYETLYYPSVKILFPEMDTPSSQFTVAFELFVYPPYMPQVEEEEHCTPKAAHFKYTEISSEMELVMGDDCIPSEPRAIICSVKQNDANSNLLDARGGLYVTEPGDPEEENGPDIFGGDPIDYIFVAQVDKSANLAIQNMAIIPNPAEVTEFSDDFWVTNGIGEVLTDGLINWLRTPPTAGEDKPNCATQGSYFGLDANFCSDNTEIDNEDVKFALTNLIEGEKCGENPICQGPMREILYMTNPAYFDETGYIGTTALLEEDTLALYESFSIDMIEPIVPAELTTISLELPEGKEYDEIGVDLKMEP